MKRNIGMLDVVALLVDLPEAGLIKGEMGTVVEILAPSVYEVEFSDKHGQAYAELAGEFDSSFPASIKDGSSSRMSPLI